MSRIAPTEYPVHELIAARWSPVGFEDRPVEADELRSLLEAARWAASSFNEQPWHYLIATRDDTENFARLLSCLVDANIAWAKHAPVLLMTVTQTHFQRNGKPNAAAWHDIGLASGNLSLEATARGLSVHQMIGILPDRARELFSIPDGYDPVTCLAIGYAADPATLPDDLRRRDEAPRRRKPLTDFVFTGNWGEVSGLVS